MKTHRYHCFGPAWAWPYRYAYSTADSHRNSSSSDSEANVSEAEVSESEAYATREHRQGGRRSGGFGARRPLRFLGYQLDLDEKQRRKIGAVLNDIKVDREQAALDEKKMISELADQIGRSERGPDAFKQTLSTRVRSTEHLQGRIADALEKIIETLDGDQCEEFAYLLRTGAFRI